MTKRFKMLPPMMPNFLPYESGVDTTSAGQSRVPVSNLTKEEATEYGELMKQAFIKHWEKKQSKI